MWRGRTTAGARPVPSAFFASFIFFLNLFFQIQPSGELDSVVMNFPGEANAVPVPSISLLTQAHSSVEEKLNLIHKLNSLGACCWFCSSVVKLIELGCKVIGISAVSFRIILHVILIIVQRELDAICWSSISLLSLNRSQKHKGNYTAFQLWSPLKKEGHFRNVKDKTTLNST